MRPPQRTAIAVVGAILLAVVWLLAVEDLVLPEDAAPVAVTAPPVGTIIAPPLRPQAAGGSAKADAAANKKTVRELQAELEEMRAKLAAYESVDADGDAKKVVALQQALADCKRARAVADAGRHPDEKSRALPDHNGKIDRIVETRSPPVAPPRQPKPGHPQLAAPTHAPPTMAAHVATRRFDAGTQVIPVLLFTYNRPERLENTLNDLLRVMPDRGFKLFVSQDGDTIPAVGSIIERVAKKHPDRSVEHIIHKRDDSGARPIDIDQGWQAYYAIAHHYQSSVNKVFKADGGHYSRVLLLEDDMEIAHDFFELMQATAPLFDKDASLYCVSGFNDNGKPERVSDATLLYRSDFFPGLGWMTSRAIWEELEAIWPKGFWDDWMRQPDKRKGRSCIRPEVPRSRALCADVGTSGGQFCEHLDQIRVAREYIDWNKMDLAYLREPAYGRSLTALLAKARAVNTVFEVATLPDGVDEAKVLYRSNDELVALEEQLELMTDFKDGVPRTAYHGVVSIRYKGKRLHLVPTKELYVYS